jgi:D-alanine-D-alanine ligase
VVQRIRIAIVYGGRSSEHEISVVSAGSVLAALDPAKYEIVTIGITRPGAWVLTDAATAQFQITDRSLPAVSGPSDPGVGEASTPVSGGPAVFGDSSATSVLSSVDVVFPVLHGAYGEDGTIQGMLEMAGVPYVGSGVLASAMAMDKAVTKTMVKAAGLTVGSFLTVQAGSVPDERELSALGLPLFVKPARGGSSLGISKVRRPDELPAALELALTFDSKVLVEAAVSGREIECGVLQDADGSVSASLPAEIRLRPDIDWYDFDAKYLDDACEFDIPPDLDEEVIADVRSTACRAFAALDCSGLARVDFFLTPAGSIVLNEINTMPGFTPISMYPRMWAETGVSYSELIDRLVATALARR